MILRASSSLTATRDSLTFTITFPPSVLLKMTLRLRVSSDALYDLRFTDIRQYQRHHAAPSFRMLVQANICAKIIG